MSVIIGDQAPVFILQDQDGNTFSLKDFIGKTNILLYFYPKDETPGCITEACGFRDSITDFEGYNCKIVGISKDSVHSHAKFAWHYKLPFTLLSDKKNAVRKLYGVESSILGLLPGRKSYLIDKLGTVTHIFDYQFKAKQHVIDTLKALSNE
jgi:peroxiredoxin Q/BCP